jgi:lincosamide nucleotidyltransferase A/C/D/E
MTTPPRAYRDRQPRRAMDAGYAVSVVDLLKGGGVPIWVDGGWGADALLGEQTREHDDLDLVAELRLAPRVIELLVAQRYELVAGGAPKSFVLVDAVGRQVDVHPVTFDDEGGGVYVTDDGGQWVYPAAGFAGRGRIADHAVRCLTPEVQVIVHNGYELAEKDFRELRLLHERFGVELPADVRARALAAE